MMRRGVLCIIALMGALSAQGGLAAGSAQLAVGPPDVDAILFTDDALYISAPGIISAEASDPVPLPGEPVGTPVEVYYRMDRKTGVLTRVAAPPPGAQGVQVSSVSLVNLNRGWSTASITYLVSSDGAIYSLNSFSCGPMGYGVHMLTPDCKQVLPAVLKPAELPTAMEEFGPYQLIGTSSMVPGTAATTGSRGVLVLSAKDGSLVRTLNQADGLPEDMIKLIRRDPVTGNLWVETPRSLTELSPKFEVQRVLYLHLGLDTGGVPSLVMGDAPEYDDPYAVLALKLHVTDFTAYKAAVAAIPSAERNTLFTRVFPQEQAGGSVPAEFAPLLPFVVADLQRDPDPRQSLFALSSLCMFNGPAVKETADKLITGTKGVTGINVWYKVKTCADPAVVSAHAPPPRQPYTGGGMNVTAYAMQDRMSQPNLSIESFSPPLLYWDGKHPVRLEDNTIDDGGGTAGPSITRWYVSPVLPVDPADAVMIAERPVPALDGGGGDKHAMDVMLPATLPPGLYYAAPCANADHKYPQAFEVARCRIPRLAPRTTP